jgi:hypothetical protein
LIAGWNLLQIEETGFFMKHTHTLIFALRIFFVLAVALVSVPVSSQGIQSKLQAAIFVKILGYDQTMSQKPGKSIEFHLVLDAAVQGNKGEIQAGFATINNAAVSARKVVVSTVAPAQISSGLDNGNAHVFYLPEGTTAATLKSALDIGRSRKVPVFCGSESMVQQGCAVGITVEAGKPRIVINASESRLQGMNLSSQLLQLAKIVK